MYKSEKPGTIKGTLSSLDLRFKKMSPSRFLVLGFIVIVLIGGILLTLPISNVNEKPVRFIDALFTSTSATCVTGLVVVDTATTYTRFGQVVIMLLIQVGGLGFMAMATMIFVLLGRRIGLRSRLLLQESYNQFSIHGLVKLTKTVIGLTLFIEGTGALLLFLRLRNLMPLGEAVFASVFEAVSAFCNAGFDVFGNFSGPFSNLSYFIKDGYVPMVIGILIIIGGLGFPVLAEVLALGSSKNTRISIHTRLVLTITAILLALGTVLVFALEYTNPETLKGLPAVHKVWNSIFMSITPRTAGFNVLKMGALRAPTVMVIMLLMFIGASPSSTGGGIKTVTAGVLILGIMATIKGDDNVEYYERRIPKEQVLRATAVVLLAAVVVLAGVFIMSMVDSAPLLDMLFEVVSAFGTVGLSRGITPGLSDISKLTLIITMLIGRLGPLTFAVALNYRASTKKARVSFPEEHVMIG